MTSRGKGERDQPKRLRASCTLWRKNTIEGNLARLQFRFSYVNKLAIDSVHDAEGDGSQQDRNEQLSKRLTVIRFILVGIGGVKSAIFYFDKIT